MRRGAALYVHLKASPTNHPYDGIPVDAGDRHDLDDAATRFVAWFERLFYQPPAADAGAWVPERLEYAFACSAPTGDGGRSGRGRVHAR